MKDYEDVLNYNWIDNFWWEILGAISNRRWRFLFLTNGPLSLRDNLAAFLIQGELGGRDDYSIDLVRPDEAAYEDRALGPDENLVIVGWPRRYCASQFGLYARWLEASARGHMVCDANGNEAMAIRYGTRSFEHRAIDERDNTKYRLASVDYGVVAFRRGVVGQAERRVCAIYGISMLGTLGMAAILTNRDARRQLAREASRVTPPLSMHRPREAMELCVRINVESPSELAKLPRVLLNSGNALPFSWSLEAMSLAVQPTGYQTYFADHPGIELEFQKLPDGSGRVCRVGRDTWAKVPAMPAAVLEYVIQWPKSSTHEALCGHLDRVREQSGLRGRPARRNNVAQNVHHINAALGAATGEVHAKYVHYSHADKVYTVNGVRFRPFRDDGGVGAG